VRTCQQIELARENLSRLRARAEVLMMEPVPYDKVRGVGFYRQFLRTRDWPEFMLAGHAGARRALSAVDPPEVRSQAHRDLRRENEPDQHRRAALSVGTAHDM
jgi:hypothetical protein